MSESKSEVAIDVTSSRPELGGLVKLGEQLDTLLPTATSLKGLVKQVELLKSDVIRATEEIA